MQNNMQMIRVQILDHRGRVGDKNIRVELERIVSEVPTRRTKTSAEKDESIARQIFFSESFCLGENVRLRRKRAMRLHVTERPFRRHDRRARRSEEHRS